MHNRYHKGLRGEWLVAWYLRLKGYRVRAMRYKTRYGEIDIVATRGRSLVFVEVKARQAVEEGLYAVTPQAQERIARAATAFMQRRPRFNNYNTRFDAVVVRPYRLPYHIQDAWRLS